MYLGIDFLATPELEPRVVEVNVGLPGGAQEYDLTHLVRRGRPSDIFERIEKISLEVYSKPFKAYINSLPFLDSLKPFKIWLDGKGPFPQWFHPALRLEDKWVQYQILNSLVPLPETRVYVPERRTEAEKFLKERGRLVWKRRLGRGGRGFRMIDKPSNLPLEVEAGYGGLLQERVDSRVDGFVVSIRSVSFCGRPVCMYANLSCRSYSNHGVLASVEPGDKFGLSDRRFEIRAFNQRSWEAEIWFGEHEPAYLHHNLYEDEVATAALIMPEKLFKSIEEISVRIENLYESLDFSTLPRACFEEPPSAPSRRGG
jgi:hypothetical protein